MPIGADISAQYTEEAVGGGHPTKARVIDRLALEFLHVDGKPNLAKLPINAGVYFQYATTTSCTLLPTDQSAAGRMGLHHGGHVPFLDGFGNYYHLIVPAAGVTVTNGGLSPGNVYYCYAYDDNGVVALAFDTTVPDFSSGKFIPTKTGDDSRTLVGMTKVNGSAQFVFAPNDKYHVKSYWNQRPLVMTGANVNGNSSSTTWATQTQLGFLSFGTGDVFQASVSGAADHYTINNRIFTAIDVDASAVGNSLAISGQNEVLEKSGGGAPKAVHVSRMVTGLAMGTHTVEFVARMDGNTGDIYNTRLQVVLWG